MNVIGLRNGSRKSERVYLPGVSPAQLGITEDHCGSGLELKKNLAAALSSALLLWLAFPPASFSILAFVAFVPLFLIAARLSPRASFVYGLASGTTAHMLIFYWVLHVPAYHLYHHLMVFLYLGVYTALWCAMLPLLKNKDCFIPSCQLQAGS